MNKKTLKYVQQMKGVYVPDILKKTTNKIRILNQVSVELGNAEKNLIDKNNELRIITKKSEEVKIETENKKLEKGIYEKAITDKSKLSAELTKNIDQKVKRLGELQDGIDGQIEANRIKEAKELAGIREKIVQVKNDLDILDRELDDKKKENHVLLAENRNLEEKIRGKTREFNEFDEEMDRQRKDIESRNQSVRGRESSSSEREKKLNFYNKRLQRYAQRIGSQLKEL